MNCCQKCVRAMVEFVFSTGSYIDHSAQTKIPWPTVPESDCQFWAHKALNTDKVTVTVPKKQLQKILDGAAPVAVSIAFEAERFNP
jgi:hypothetical protein